MPTAIVSVPQRRLQAARHDVRSSDGSRRVAIVTFFTHLTENDGAKFKEAEMAGGNNHALTRRSGRLKMVDAFVFATKGERLRGRQSSYGDVVRNSRAKIYENRDGVLFETGSFRKSARLSRTILRMAGLGHRVGPGNCSADGLSTRPTKEGIDSGGHAKMFAE